MPAALPGAVLATVLAVAAAAPAAAAAPSSSPAPATYIVSGSGSTTAATLASAIDRQGGSVDTLFPHVGSVVATLDADDVARLSATAGVLSVERNTTFHISDAGAGTGSDAGTGAAGTPGTHQLNAPWDLDRIDQEHLPLDGTYTSASTGAGVTAYVLDTGIRATHADLYPRVAAGFDALAAPGDTSGASAATDCNGHGTHVAGLIGGSFYGVAKAVSLVPVRVTDCTGAGTLAQVLAGVDWVTAHHAAGTPAVANMSLGGAPSPALQHAVEASIASGITYVVAAGNDDADACAQSPANIPAVLTVGATDAHDQRSTFSDDGPCLDLFAPGEDVVSDWGSNDIARAIASGTSMASPLVAGAAALVLSRHPDATPAQVSAIVLGEATSGTVTDPAGAPNLLVGTSSATSSARPIGAVGGPVVLPSAVLRDLATTTGRDVARTAGADRYATSAATSAATFPTPVARAYLAVGTTYPDALAAAAAAGAAHAPVLLVTPGAIPDAVRAELVRLAPARISVVGGPSAISDAVVDAARPLAATVDRMAGADRYATAAAVSVDAHATGSTAVATVYLASGASSPDALSASSAAALAGAPLLLTDPAGLPDATAAELARLHPTTVVVVGGTAVVPDAVATAAAAAAGAAATLVRLQGPDRYATASAVLASMPAVAAVDVATGEDFPDALAGAAAASASGHALVIVPPTPLPAALRSGIAAVTAR